MARLWVGTSGWNYRHWAGDFYPSDLKPRDWFGYYAGHFATVEINASFYREPARQTFEKWRDAAPDGFRFAVKAHRFLTHRKRLIDPADPLDRVVKGARRLGKHLGPVLYQLPPTFHRKEENSARLDAFLEILPADLDHVVEFRHDSWYTRDTQQQLRRHNVALCWHDMGGKEVPFVVTAPLAYLRFHGGEKKYAGNYPDEVLAEHARRIQHLAEKVDDVWIYFNNDIGGHAVRNAKTLIRLLENANTAASQLELVTV
jgi:uncharacterized protein YecE (DUF72 family)